MHAIEIQLTTKDTTIDPAGEPVTVSGMGADFTEASFDLLLEIETAFGELDMPARFELADALRSLEATGQDVETVDSIITQPGYTLRLVRAA